MESHSSIECIDQPIAGLDGLLDQFFQSHDSWLLAEINFLAPDFTDLFGCGLGFGGKVHVDEISLVMPA